MMGYVELIIYNELGQEIRTLVSEIQNAGYKTIIWDGKDSNNDTVHSGIYLCSLNIGTEMRTRKLLFIK